MSGEQNTVFISYRRSTSKHLAGRIFDHLRSHGYDVFLDVTTIDSGEFDRIILNQIAARAHFVLLLSPGALLRCANEGDWLRREIEEAFRLNRNIIPIFDEGFNLEEERQHLPETLRTELPRRNGVPLYHFYFDAGMETLRTRFLKQPVYDVAITPTPSAEQAEVERRIEQAIVSIARSEERQLPPLAKDIAVLRELSNKVQSVIGAPFDWCSIPQGVVLLEDASNHDGTKGGLFEVSAFAIAKYPITNEQYEVFASAKKDGYTYARWWDYSREAKKWRARHTKAAKTAFAGNNLPCTIVCWYDAVAYCRWLSWKLALPVSPSPSGRGDTSILITLPTEQQWQRAAQGNDNRNYPWGKELPDAAICNFNRNVGQPTPVTWYPKGASPYEVMDMSGNVWEWCLTEWGTDHTSTYGNNPRVVRGGSWKNQSERGLRTTTRDGLSPDAWYDYVGFRLALLY